MKTAYNDWAPRVSIAYSPDTKTVVRAGFGIFYNQDIGNSLFDVARNLSAKIQLNETNGLLNDVGAGDSPRHRRNGRQAYCPDTGARGLHGCSRGDDAL